MQLLCENIKQYGGKEVHEKLWTSSLFPERTSKSIEEYADASAIGFAEWIDNECSNNKLARVVAESSKYFGQWTYSGYEPLEFVTTLQLYKIYKASLK